MKRGENMFQKTKLKLKNRVLSEQRIMEKL